MSMSGPGMAMPGKIMVWSQMSVSCCTQQLDGEVVEPDGIEPTTSSLQS
jgi:hypothetical protein